LRNNKDRSGREKLKKSKARKQETRESVLWGLYQMLDGMNERIEHLHTREVKTGDPNSSIVISNLRILISERQHRVAVLLGIEEAAEPKTHISSALSFF